jgi:transposase
MKISIVYDDFKVPISIKISDSRTHDSLIIIEQLETISKNTPQFCNNNTTLIGDAAYDNNNIRDKMKVLKMGKLLTGYNKRNTKNPKIIKERKHPLHERLTLKSRINIEHSINELKQFNRIKIRMDKYSKNYESYLNLAAIYIILRRTRMYRDT